MKAIINGAGIAGLASAYFLGRKGWEVTILEKAPSRRTAGYMIDFFGSGYDAAEAGGLLPALQARHHQVGGVTYLDEMGRTRSSLDYDQFSASLGGRLMSLLRGDVEQTLFEAVPTETDLRFGTSVAEVRHLDGRVELTTTTGEDLSADLLIGADGIHSHLRQLVFGPEEQYLRFLGFHTAAFIFEDKQIEATLAGRFLMLSVPKRQVGLYAIGGGQIAAFFAHASDNPNLPADPVAALRAAYGDLGWQVPRMLEALDGGMDVYYDVVAQIEMPHWTKGRTVLVGDAAYAVSLLAGQGASLAVGGAYMLGEALARDPIEAALAAFERDLQPAVAAKQAAGRKTADWFVPPTAFHNTVRDVFLNAVRLPIISGLLGRFFAPSAKSVVR